MIGHVQSGGIPIIGSGQPAPKASPLPVSVLTLGIAQEIYSRAISQRIHDWPALEEAQEAEREATMDRCMNAILRNSIRAAAKFAHMVHEIHAQSDAPPAQ